MTLGRASSLDNFSRIGTDALFFKKRLANVFMVKATVAKSFTGLIAKTVSSPVAICYRGGPLSFVDCRLTVARDADLDELRDASVAVTSHFKAAKVIVAVW